MSINITITGNIGTAPEYKLVGANRDQAVTEFRLAHTPDIRTDEGWKKGEITTWYDVKCWGRLAAHVAERLSTGDRVTVTSTRDLQPRGWPTDDGEIRTAVAVTAADVALSMVFDQQTR